MGITIQTPDIDGTDNCQTAMVSVLFNEEGILQYLHETILVMAVDSDGDIIGALTENAENEWSIAVDAGFQGQGIATRMIKEALEQGESGFMVAGTDAGLEFLFGLYHKLTPEEREGLDVTCWADLENEDSG
jgi:GNAT superfamily N-acetyltransferase